MDKGLDIAERRCVLALHAAAADSRRILAALCRAFVTGRCDGLSIEATARELDAAARSLGREMDWASAERGLRWSEGPNRSIVTIFDPEFPKLLREIATPPVVLFADGDAGTLSLPQVAIVGSRKASPYGSGIAFEYARALGVAGFAVTSGLARGIDTAAHRGALEVAGVTIAVFGCGIDRVYPVRNRDLAARISGSGVLISEFPLGSPPRPYHFPRRNRIIGGLSLGTVVVEAARRSGSISTAMHALEQGREVFAVPGSIRNPLARGCHDLIRQGATLVDSADDILQQLPAVTRGHPSPVRQPVSSSSPLAGLSARERRVLENCAHDATTFDEIVQRSGLTPPDVSSILSALEVRGLVRSLAGNTYLQIVS